ncbi:Sua5/YciO/YrdC/YwlC family protein [Mesomycoplasma hyorhinis]|uniref:L-threonylcarbamoyladenylate synthase n=1 Tax=Mesomycoplasma hyorhinis TaxID=2100 RepID=A0ABD6IDJ1_MESHY|nr:Sua5/YciO/YrdC/YwlC family protein [Mesomycoplasma hyorhinis]MXR06209.1 translation factor Sua5 [Mesomycoplasma hyorhinis]MXR06943.1 translation factor Sua5 [Mesomycoplasma hyorhinis]MXR07695.1 translation factor Sua5 [Mesomycoplasma hyorhinis]MXR09209.1 translation factor Sua5 [Mesomycoplasma hyorhinis]MXR11291.1 translation factor Sua5 [Mesomycoplasma hyorhinis]
MTKKYKQSVLINNDSKKQLLNYFLKHKFFKDYDEIKNENDNEITLVYSSCLLSLKFCQITQNFFIFLHFSKSDKSASLFKIHILRFFKKLKKYSKVFLLTTDTLVGLGTFLKNPNLKQIYLLKKRPLIKKIIILIGKIEQLNSFISKENYQKYQKEFQQHWPGSTTLIIEKQGFRIPNNLAIQELLIKEGPAFVTSANISNEKNLTLEQARKKFFCIFNVYNLTIGNGIASKIIDLDNNKILR